MDKNEWYRVGEDIRDQVQRAVETSDFTGLGKTIGDTVNRAVGDMSNNLNRAVGDMSDNLNRTVGNSLNRTVETVGDVVNRAVSDVNNSISSMEPGRNKVSYRKSDKYRKPNIRPDARLFDRHPKGEATGIVCMAVGYSSMGIFALVLVRHLISFLLYGGNVVPLAITGAVFLAGFILGSYGSRLKGRTNRYRVYVDMVKEKLYCSIQDMASRTGRSERYIRRDLKKMMRLGMFRQAHLDQKETCLIASNEMYEQYKRTQKHYEETLQNEKQKAAESRVGDMESEAQGSEVDQVIEEGRGYIRLIRQCNDEIPGEEMSDKLDRLEVLVTRIFAQVEREPQLAPELRKMLSFYLPTTKKLLEAYRDLDRQQIDVSNIAQTKREIEMAVDTINEAFEKFLDELFRDKAWDIQSDISVLHTMLKQDGYLEKDFDAQEKG